MKRPFFILAITGLAAILIVSISQARKSSREKPRRTLKPVTTYHTKGLSDLPIEQHGRRLLSMPDTNVLAEYTFDFGGMPDPMGWISVDRTAQEDTVFHVADATELDGGTFGGLLVLEGMKSLWCGVDAQDTPPYCNYAALPGYGGSWDQRFVSAAFYADTIYVSWKIRWDSEPEWDRTYVEYTDSAGAWVALPVNGGLGYYDGIGDAVEWHEISSDCGSPFSTQIRFRFVSDGAWNDQDGLWDTDGACIVDSILVTDQDGVTLCYEDFESEAPGARTTVDGLWQATGPEGFGKYAALYNAYGLLQEDPCYTSISSMWGFFDDPSITNYACSEPIPHPEQGAVPYGDRSGFNIGPYLYNEIWSPVIPLTGSGSHVLLEFDVYRDLRLDPLIFYRWAVRSWVDGCPTLWQDDGLVHYGGFKEWYGASFEIAN